MEKRLFTAFALLLLSLGSLVARVAVVAVDPNYSDASAEQSTYTVKVASMRGTIYDRFLRPLVNAERTSVEGANANLLSDYEVVSRIGEKPLAVHTIGTLDAQGKGASGIEAAYDKLLSSCGGTLSVQYTLDAKGKPLAGAQPKILDENYDTGAGLALTLDAEIQKIAQDASDSIERGAVVVMDPKTGDLLAVVSRPSFDPENMGPSLTDERAPFVNRAFSAYSVGSTFKLLVSAAAIDAGISPQRTFDCTGEVEVGGLVFHCHQRNGHGMLDLAGALEHSCNPYFITLALQIGGESLRTAADSLGFGTAAELAPGYRTAAGALPSWEELHSPAALANFGFGQGTLTATPVQLACLVSAIANGGGAVTPRLVCGTTANGEDLFEKTASYAVTPVFSKESAALVRERMIGVVEEGSGRSAKPERGGAGGKTASAQTGQFLDGEEIVHAWFAGFYPAEEPAYTIVVFVEGGDSGSETACPVFREIADGLAKKAG